MSAEPHFLVTGAHGCIGAWVTHELVVAGDAVSTFDLSDDGRRLRLLLSEEEVRAVPHVVGDITDRAALEHALDEHGITNVIHLAALQVPLCRADPPLGARVNVVGTINVLEAVKQRVERMAGPVVYASSVAALAPDGAFDKSPSTLYGVYKQANEDAAAVYFRDERVSSVGLRPHTVYGVGRDQGITSAPTLAMLAAAARVPFTIPYSGKGQLQLARDVARAFIDASRSGYEGACVHSLPSPVVAAEEVVAAIASVAPESEIGFTGEPLPFPAEAGSGAFAEIASDFTETPLVDGVRETIQRFRLLLEEGRVAAPEA